ncbi:MAG: ribosome silencing factor [Actinomycetota bacterium]
MTGSRELVVTAARAAAEKQARDIILLDVRELIVITDYFLIVSGTSDRQVRTIAEEIDKAVKVKAKGLKAVRREGEREGHWALLDFVDFVAHVFLEEDRRFYELERLWSDAPTVDWEEAKASTGG